MNTDLTIHPSTGAIHEQGDVEAVHFFFKVPLDLQGHSDALLCVGRPPWVGKLQGRTEGLIEVTIDKALVTCRTCLELIHS